MSSDSEASWDKFLNPDVLKQNLMIGGMYLAAFEMLKDSLIGRPRDFFSDGFRDGKWIVSPEYKMQVLNLDKHAYTASSLWWQQQGAIDTDDVNKLAEVREHRDLIAHNLPTILSTIEHGIRYDLLCSICELLSKIDNWWIRNVEIPSNPDYDGAELTEEELDGASSMNSLFLPLLLQVAAGDDSRMRNIYEVWLNRKK